MKNPHVKVEKVSKRFRRNMKSFKSMAGYLLGMHSPEDFWALKDISFELHPGDTLGIIGKNGSGKSTLLKIITKITVPTEGHTKTHGRMGAMIEVGAGFHPDLTGRETIFLYGAILGMAKKEIYEKFDEIVDFAGIEQFLDTPIKFYSSGMNARLGFAVTISMNPDILIVDEALAVGDFEFQEKCLRKMLEFKKKGKIIILVSHNHDMIRQYMDRVLWLEHGKIVMDGKPENVYKKVFEEKN